MTYSFNNGLKLYVNGTQYGSATDSFTYSTANIPVTVTLGSPLAGTDCMVSAIVPGQYNGYMDEYQLYSRELNSTDILTVANP